MVQRSMLMLLVLLAIGASAGDPQKLISQGTTAFEAREYAQAAELFESAVKAATQAGLKAPRASYNAACCHALLGKANDAFAWLDKALDAGWRSVEAMKADADLQSLHADSRWERVVERCREEEDKFNRSLKEPALRSELLKRMNEDQRIRLIPNPDIAEWEKINADNTAYMKTVIEKYGWPGNSMVGADGALAAFLLVQHADAEVAFQKRCLDLLTKAVDQKEASAANMAYLTDRILVWEGKPQRYGTQFLDTRSFRADGELKLQPIEDEANVDARRKEIGLPPLADYVKRMKEMQQP